MGMVGRRVVNAECITVPAEMNGATSKVAVQRRTRAALVNDVLLVLVAVVGAYGSC
jgi:hypothetical protein